MIGNANYNLSIALCRTGTARGTYTAPCSVNYKGKVTSFNSIAAINHEIGHTFTCPHTSALTPSGGFSPYISFLEPSTMGGGGQFFACTSIETLAEWAIAGNHITCATQSPSGNAAPQITPTVDGKYMPANTPFVLANTNTTDADGDPLYYSWQSTDGYRTQYPDSSFSSPTEYLIFAPERPNAAGNIRYVPYLSNLVSGIDDPYSHLPWVTRDIHVRCLVRDSVGGVNMTFETVHVDGNSGPFKVNTPIAGDVVTELQTITVNWDVAGTTAAPVSAANVEILLSTDGGVTFPVVLTASTPNDGSQAVTIPNGTATSTARIMVKGNGIFFHINPSDFTIYDNALPPDYAIYSYDTLKRACASSISYEFIAQSLGGYSNPVTFSVSNLPAGVTSNFPQTINPGQHVNLVLSTISPSMHGTYHLTLTTTSTSGTKTQELDLIIAGQIQTTNNYAMSAISTTDGRRYSIPDLTWNPSEYSVEYWVKFDPAAMGVNSSSIYWGGSGNQFIRKNADNHLYMRVNDGAHINLISSIDTVVPNRWYHVVGTYKNRKVNLYVDGVHQGQGNYGILDPLPWTSVSVGYQTSQGLSGQFDEVRIWNKCLTLSEVRDRMHLNLSADDVCSGNVELYLQFEQDSSTVYDVTGNHSVVPVNGPSSALSDCPTAAGVSVRKTISSTGAVSFDDALADTDLDITFNANPNGEVVAYKLLSIPNGTQPSFMDLNENAFWIVRNFGDTTLSYNATLSFTDPVFNTNSTAANYSVKQRQSFKATGSWSNATIGSSYASNEVGFSGFNKFGHFAYGIDDDLNVNELTDDSWVLYPNPTDSKLTMVFQTNSDKELTILNTLGEKVYSANFSQTVYNMDISSLSSGVYYVQLVENGALSLKKLVVQSKI
ncbi:Ser-Thr-rich glycosyl-phosphatidyl-inositol-anchored membrane family protein [compost metagenome]